MMLISRDLIERTLMLIEPMSLNPFGALRILIGELREALDKPFDPHEIATGIVQDAIVADAGDEVKAIEFRCVDAIEAWLKERP